MSKGLYASHWVSCRRIRVRSVCPLACVAPLAAWGREESHKEMWLPIWDAAVSLLHRAYLDTGELGATTSWHLAAFVTWPRGVSASTRPARFRMLQSGYRPTVYDTQVPTIHRMRACDGRESGSSTPWGPWLPNRQLEQLEDASTRHPGPTCRLSPCP